MRYNGDITEIIKMVEHIKIDNDITNTMIADRMGKSKQIVSNFLNGRQPNATLDTLKMYADALGYDIDIDFIKKSK